jgi:hypothetical protein
MIRLVPIAAMLAAIIAAPALAQEAPDLKGTWSGNGKGMTPDGVVTGKQTLVVTEQDENVFRAQISYDVDGTTYTEDAVGAIAPDGKAFFYGGNDGMVAGTIQSDTTLDICYIEIGDDAQANCARLTK